MPLLNTLNMFLVLKAFFILNQFERFAFHVNIKFLALEWITIDANMIVNFILYLKY